MKRLLKTFHGRFAISFLCSMLLFLDVVTYSPSSDVTVQQPLAVAAQPTSHPVADAGISAQPFIAIAQQAKAGICP